MADFCCSSKYRERKKKDKQKKKEKEKRQTPRGSSYREGKEKFCFPVIRVKRHGVCFLFLSAVGRRSTTVVGNTTRLFWITELTARCQVGCLERRDE